MIRDLTSTMFYKASFTVEDDSGEDVLWGIILAIREWIKYKASRDDFSFPMSMEDWTNLKNGGQLYSSDKGTVLLSCLHIEEDALTWACKLIEEKEPLRGLAPRKWVTEIGFRGETYSRGIVSIVLSYEDRPGFIGRRQDDPSPTIPKIVNLLLDSKTLHCSVSGISITRDAKSIADARTVFEMISDHKRDLPIILVTPTATEKYPIPPNDIAHSLGPNALVVYPDEQSVLDELNTLMAPYSLKCFSGALRVYATAPNLENPGEFARHRYITENDIEEVGGDEILAMLRRALAQDVHFWQKMLRIEDIKRLNWKSSQEKNVSRREKELSKKYQDETLEDVLKLEQEKDEATLLYEQAEEEIATLQSDNDNLKNRCQSFEQAFADLKQNGRNAPTELYEYMQKMAQFPCSAEEVVRMITFTFPDRIVFTERGYHSLEDCKTDVSILWRALYDISTVLQPLFASEEHIDIAKEFNNKSQFKYAKSEGQQTRKDPKLMSLRKDMYQEREIDIEPHISSGTGDPNSPRFIRVYLAWDSITNKVVIGHCGTHLDNYSTKSMH